MPYLKLFLGRPQLAIRPEDRGEPGPIFGPVPFFYGITGREIRFDNDKASLSVVDDVVYYDGMFYGDWSVFDGPPEEEDAKRQVPFDPAKATVPGKYQLCDCMQRGYFHSGVPGVIAHLENGRLPPDANVERCSQCCRYPDDESARQKLVELGLIWKPDQEVARYSVHCYATVRVKFSGITASTLQDAARIAGALFDWDEHQHLAEYAEELTEFLVDVEGEAGFSKSRYFNADFQEVNR